MTNTSKKFKINLILSIVLCVLCVSIFLFLAIKYAVSGGFNIDNVFIKFSKSIRSEFLTGLFKIVTHLGSFITLIIATAILVIVLKPVLAKIFVVVNIGFVGAFCLIVKHIVERPRPIGIALIEETGFSFPSAHSMISVVFYGFIIFLIWKYLKNKKLNIVLTVTLTLIAIIIGYTRVYLGVHYITDVVAGFVAGGAYLIVAIWAYNIIENLLSRRKRVEKQKE